MKSLLVELKGGGLWLALESSDKQAMDDHISRHLQFDRCHVVDGTLPAGERWFPSLAYAQRVASEGKVERKSCVPQTRERTLCTHALHVLSLRYGRTVEPSEGLVNRFLEWAWGGHMGPHVFPCDSADKDHADAIYESIASKPFFLQFAETCTIPHKIPEVPQELRAEFEELFRFPSRSSAKETKTELTHEENAVVDIMLDHFRDCDEKNVVHEPITLTYEQLNPILLSRFTVGKFLKERRIPRLVFIGDSILENASEQLTQAFKNSHRVFVAAVGGDRTEHAIWRMERLKPFLDDESTPDDRIIILLGHNNLERDCPEDIYAGIDAVEKCLGVARDRVLLLPVPPCWPKAGSKYIGRPHELESKRRALNAMIQARSETGALFEGLGGDDARNENYVDHVHFSPRGNERFTELVWSKVTRRCC